MKMNISDIMPAEDQARRQRDEVAEAQKLVDAGDTKEYFELSWGRHYVWNGKVLKAPRPVNWNWKND